eukprot:274650-Prymnesium_polylepis.2
MRLPCTRDPPHSVAASVPSPASRAACSQALHDRRALPMKREVGRSQRVAAARARRSPRAVASAPPPPHRWAPTTS